MDQMSFSDAEYQGKRKQTRRERFLEEMEQVVPWQALIQLIEPYYPKAGQGRRPYRLSTMLRIYCLQQWYGLSDPGAEEATERAYREHSKKTRNFKVGCVSGNAA